jgi:hypothetical protein
MSKKIKILAGIFSVALISLSMTLFDKKEKEDVLVRITAPSCTHHYIIKKKQPRQEEKNLLKADLIVNGEETGFELLIEERWDNISILSALVAANWAERKDINEEMEKFIKVLEYEPGQVKKWAKIIKENGLNTTQLYPE